MPTCLLDQLHSSHFEHLLKTLGRCGLFHGVLGVCLSFACMLLADPVPHPTHIGTPAHWLHQEKAF